MLNIARIFTEENQKAEETLIWQKDDVEIKDIDGSTIFSLKNGEYPEDMSATARSIAASKYFRRAGVPQEDGSLGAEKSFKQTASRLAKCWRHWGDKYDYFDSPESAENFEQEILYMLYHQMVAPNSPQWFNTGLNLVYGINSEAQGHYYVDPATGKEKKSKDAYTRPQPHACLTAGHMILTKDGYKQIEHVEVGDEVLTHRGRFRKVTHTMSRVSYDPLTHFDILGVNGHAKIVSTDNHPFLTYQDGVEKWVDARDLSKGSLLAFGNYAENTEDGYPEYFQYNDYLPGESSIFEEREDGTFLCTRTYESYGGRYFSQDFEEPDDRFKVTEEALYLIGYYLGDGYCRNEELEFSFGEADLISVERLKALIKDVTGYEGKVEVKGGCGAYLQVAKRRGLYYFIEKEFGRTSKDKQVPDWIFTLPKKHKEHFLAGLIDSDGFVSDKRLYISNSNPRIVAAVTLIAQELGYAVLPSFKRDIKWRIKGKSGISKKVNWVLNFRPMKSAKLLPSIKMETLEDFRGSSVEQINSRYWTKVKKTHIQENKGTKVFNLQVEEDESYIVSGIITHNCFIQDIQDDLVNSGGIMDLWMREARLFKYGSGTGTNFSNIRGAGEPLSGGGTSSGLMSFLKIGDVAAGAIKSGGTTRRAAKMVCLDLDHPDILDFINWKAREEKKVKALIDAGYSADFNGEAYQTVSGQNSNNSVRIPHKFFYALEAGEDWNLYWRTEKQDAAKEDRKPSPCKSIPAREILDQISQAAWTCADPGVQYDSTINEWHTCPVGGKIEASNPCVEFMFLNNTACNLASLNLKKFFNRETGRYDIDNLRHAVRLWTIVLEISVLMAQFPSAEIARLSYDYRPLGLGFANIGSTLMLAGIPYDSSKGRAIAAALSSLICSEAYITSASMAEKLGSFPKYEENKEPMLKVIRNHRRAAYNSPSNEYEELGITPQGLNEEHCPKYLIEEARKSWDSALRNGEEFGYRNAQVTLVAPTGTIGLLMDCDTTGIEPEFSIVKSKKLAGGGYYKIINRSVEPALKTLGYSKQQRKDIMRYILGTNKLPETGLLSKGHLLDHGWSEEEIDRFSNAFLSSMDLRQALGEVLDPETLESYISNSLGEEYDNLSFKVCGYQTIEGAPHIKEEHLSVFDCANKCGPLGERYISSKGHLKMMAAVQPFLSGAISKTINMPEESTVDDIRDIYKMGWELGLKAVAIYRDNSKGSQILTTSSKSEDKIEEKPLEVTEEIIPQRKKLMRRRRGFTYELALGNQKIYIRTGEDEQSDVREVFIDMFKEGGDYRTLLNCFAVLFSKALQTGIPLEDLVSTFRGVKMSQEGIVEGHDYIKMASSPVDLVVRVLGMEYLDFPSNMELGNITELNGTALGPPAPEPYRTTQGMVASSEGTRIEEKEAKRLTETIRKDALNARSEKKIKRSKTTTMEVSKICPKCGMSMTPNGAGCVKCDNCGDTTGCSG